eukprot:TRINITY_DN12889_c0_g1_i1.p1 TRINITY_DN12889_c0_g1~~TRINITY_DN12889_c0_g1_i1.p1  ORF type:complete len:124 (+),score=67.19 TRINITY_DN12889_c0_g1_i1:82-453(+)
MIRRPPRSTQSRSSAASDVYKRQLHEEHRNEWRRFSLILSSFLGTIILLFALCVEYGDVSSGSNMDIQYLFYLNVTVMMLVGFGSVSYTHLRAHETVLDLVCRLLLEKKKNIHKHQYTTPDYH